jgi:protein-S-isoprenylcysteine O-methyltransferase Ste14
MYLALFTHSLGQALVLPNGVAGPSYLVALGVLFALRVRAEERMMLEQFGPEYEAYMVRTKRLVPQPLPFLVLVIGTLVTIAAAAASPAER